MAMYDNAQIVQKAFDRTFLSEYLLQAQWAELVELKKIITEVADHKQAPVSILDIGIGNARIPRHLCGITEIWDRIAVYDGTDNAPGGSGPRGDRTCPYAQRGLSVVV